MPARNCFKVMPSIVLSARVRLLLRSASGTGNCYARTAAVSAGDAVLFENAHRARKPVLNGCDVASENPDAIQAQKHCRAPHSPWRLAGQNAGRGRPKHRSVREDRWRASEGHGVARDLVITTPQARDEGVVTVSRASLATRVSPKP
jgi:hypothetical protein